MKANHMQKELYNIWREYSPHLNKERKLVKANVTLAQAQKHCQSPKTHRRGYSFDNYQEVVTKTVRQKRKTMFPVLHYVTNNGMVW